MNSRISRSLRNLNKETDITFKGPTYVPSVEVRIEIRQNEITLKEFLCSADRLCRSDGGVNN